MLTLGINTDPEREFRLFSDVWGPQSRFPATELLARGASLTWMGVKYVNEVQGSQHGTCASDYLRLKSIHTLCSTRTLTDLTSSMMKWNHDGFCVHSLSWMSSSNLNTRPACSLCVYHQREGRRTLRSCSSVGVRGVYVEFIWRLGTLISSSLYSNMKYK